MSRFEGTDDDKIKTTGEKTFAAITFQTLKVKENGDRDMKFIGKVHALILVKIS